MGSTKLKEITIRVDPEEWRMLDDKRHADRTSWQAVGIALFRGWQQSGGVTDVRPSSSSPEPAALPPALQRILDMVPPDQLEHVLVALEILLTARAPVPAPRMSKAAANKGLSAIEQRQSAGKIAIHDMRQKVAGELLHETKR